MAATVKLFFLLFFLFSCLSGSFVYAAAIKGGDNAKGWHWYDELPLRTVAKNPKKIHIKNARNATKEMHNLRKLVREAKARAILYPTEDNVRNYIVLQNFVTQRAAMFARVWKKVLLDYPSLDYGVLHPTENNAQHIIYSQDRAAENRVIAVYRKKYGLLFFYRGNNALDRELAPSIASFAANNKIALIPISVDGDILQSFGAIKSRIDHGQAHNLGIKYFPALILADPKTGEIKPLNYGFIAQDELKRRFLDVATNFKEGM